MMSDPEHTRKQLFAAIVADPSNDEPRRVYADWLLSHGDARGELIHLQCEIGKELDPDRRTMLEERADKLALQSGNRWKRDDGVARPSSNYELRRGFVESLKIYREGKWLEETQRALRDIPLLTELHVRDIVGKDMLQLLELDLSKVRHLSLNGCRIGLKGMNALGASRAIPNLEVLEIASAGLTTKAIDLLARSPSLSKITSLGLANNELPDAALDAISQSPYLRNVSSFHLDGNGFSGKAVARFLRSRSTSLVKLDLSRNPIGDEGAIAIAECPLITSLGLLHLGSCKIADRGGMALVTSPYLVSELGSFAISNNPIGPKVTQKLVSSRAICGRARTLNLAGCAIGDDGAEAVARSTLIADLERLALGHNDIGDRGAFALAAASHWTKLKRVMFHYNRIGDDGARAIASARQFLKPTVLYMAGNAFGLETQKVVRNRPARAGEELTEDEAVEDA